MTGPEGWEKRWRSCIMSLPDLGWSKNLTRSTKHSEMNALRKVSVLKSVFGALTVLAEASWCVVCLSPVSTSDAAACALISEGLYAHLGTVSVDEMYSLGILLRKSLIFKT